METTSRFCHNAPQLNDALGLSIDDFQMIDKAATEAILEKNKVSEQIEHVLSLGINQVEAVLAGYILGQMHAKMALAHQQVLEALLKSLQNLDEGQSDQRQAA